MTRAVQLVQLHSAPWIFLVGPVMLARPPLVGPWNFHFPVEDPSFCFICSLSSRWLLEIVGFGGGEKAWRRRWECTEKCCVWWGNCQKTRDRTTPSTLERISWTIEKLKLATPMPSKSSSIELTTTPSGSSTRSRSLYLSRLSRGKLSFVFDLVKLCFKTELYLILEFHNWSQVFSFDVFPPLLTPQVSTFAAFWGLDELSEYTIRFQPLPFSD